MRDFMRYRKLKIEFKEFPKHFHRVIKVREDLDLFTLGTVIVTALGGAFEHYFVFSTATDHYVPENFQILYDETHHYMTNYHLLDLGKHFTLIYDTGDGWEFKIKVYDKVEEIRSRKLGFFIDAQGQGIWEDRIGTLIGYLSGELSPDIKEDDEDGEYALPWNHHVEKLADFDFPLDIISLSENFDDEVQMNLQTLEENDVF